MEIMYKLLDPAARAPERATPGSAGLDLRALHPVVVTPRDCRNPVVVRTGIALELAAGWVGLLRPRSSLAGRLGVTTCTSGVIDSDYRGEVVVPMLALGQDAYRIEAGERFAQIVVVPCLLAEPRLVEELGETRRGAGGFGSTGA